jgi:hypothetical protein
MRKLVLIIIAFFAVVTFIRAFAGSENNPAPVVNEFNKLNNG